MCNLINTLNQFNEHMSPGDLCLQPRSLIGTYVNYPVSGQPYPYMVASVGCLQQQLIFSFITKPKLVPYNFIMQVYFLKYAISKYLPVKTVKNTEAMLTV